MSKFTDQHRLKGDQYRDSSNLDARVMLHQRFSTNPYGWFRWVFDALLKLPAHASILELGCGHGLLWKENLDRIPPGWRITLSDLSTGMLDAAWRNLVVTGRAFRFEEIDAQSIPSEDETFEAVIANHMLYHVPDRPKAIGEIKRVLKAGGRLVATTVSENHMKEMMDWLQRVSDEEYASRAALSFTLENGREQLTSFFRHVHASRYEDSLKITELEPIMAYIRSGIAVADINEAGLNTIGQELQAQLNRRGAIFIAKDSGMIEAMK